MRPLEVTLLALLLAWAAGAAASLKKRRPVWQRTLLLLLCVVAAAQVILEGWRLQMAPAYFAILLVAISSVDQKYLIVRLSLFVMVTTCALASLAGGYMFPVFTLPKPQ